MSDTKTNYRQERIERLLNELRYEIERGMFEGEVDESLRMRWYVPQSKQLAGGVVFCEFRTRPIHIDSVLGTDIGAKPALRVVK